MSTTETTDLRIDVADLRHRPGTRRDVELRAAIPSLGAGAVRVADDQPVVATLAVEALSDGVVVRGRASVDWVAECARCVEPVAGHTDVHVDELFEDDFVEGETYPLDGDELDLEQALRDALTLEFPLAPAPPLDAAGRCTVCGVLPAELPYRDEPDDPDPRWAPLRALDLSTPPGRDTSTEPPADPSDRREGA